MDDDKSKGKGKVGDRAMVYAVDFDGTLSFGKFPEIGKPNERLIKFLREAREKGDKVILWTCRGNRDEDKWLDEAVEWCKGKGLEFDKVNENLDEVVSEFGFNPRKVVADVYIDDLGLEPGRFVLNEQLKVLMAEEEAERVRRKRAREDEEKKG